jgi:hypothetical protein
MPESRGTAPGHYQPSRFRSACAKWRGRSPPTIKGQTIQALGLLENGFIFMADLVRVLEVPVICQFIKPKYRREQGTAAGFLEIFFSHELDIGQHVLLVEGLVHSGSDQRVSDERLAQPGSGFGQAGHAARPAIGSESGYSRIISGFWWTKHSWWVTGWDRRSRPFATCPTLAAAS